MTKECKQQFTLRITQANSTELIVILYEMFLCYLQEGYEAHDRGDRAAFRGAISNARGCLNELMHSLHFEHEIATNLLQLYMFCVRRLAYGEVRNDVSPLKETEGVIAKLHEAYVQAAQEDKSGPIMNNTQTVYAGLTYGKNTLTENMADQGFNRGIRV